MLSKQVGYAIRCLIYLAEQDEPVLIKDISEATDMPHPFLAKIINSLSRKGFVKSQRGIGGGITLAKKPETITICDVCIALDDPLIHDKCIIGMPECSAQTNCPFHSFWSEEKIRIKQYLENNTISTVVTENLKHKKILPKRVKIRK